MNGSNSTQYDPNNIDTYDMEHALTLMRNAAAAYKNPTHPLRAAAPDMMHAAADRIAVLNQAGKQADIQEAGQLAPPGQNLNVPILGASVPFPVGPTAAGIVGFGRGASAGLVKPPTATIDNQQVNPIEEAHPTAMTIGDAAGAAALQTIASPLAANLSAAKAGALIMGGYGAARGAADPMLTHDPVVDSVLGGLGGALFGGIGGRILGGAAPAAMKGRGLLGDMRVVGGNVRNAALRLTSYFGSRGMAPDEAAAAAETQLRAYMAKKGVSPENIENMVKAAQRGGWGRAVPVRPLAAGHDAPPIPRAVQDELAKPAQLSIPRGEDLRAQQPLTPAEAALAKTPPPEQSYAAAHPPPSEPVVPPGTHPADIERIRRGTMSVADLRAQQQQPTNPGSILRSLEAKKGSPLTDEERDRVLQNLFGKMRSGTPEHPYWRGPGSPTRDVPFGPEAIAKGFRNP